MKKIAYFSTLLFFVTLIACKKNDPTPDTPTLLAKSWQFAGAKVKTDVSSFDIPLAKASTLNGFITVTFDGAGKVTYTDNSNKTQTATYTLSDNNTKLTIIDAAKNTTIFYISSISASSLEVSLKNITESSYSSNDNEALSSILVSALFLNAIGVDYKKLNPQPKTYQPFFTYNAK